MKLDGKREREKKKTQHNNLGKKASTDHDVVIFCHRIFNMNS